MSLTGSMPPTARAPTTVGGASRRPSTPSTGVRVFLPTPGTSARRSPASRARRRLQAAQADVVHGPMDGRRAHPAASPEAMENGPRSGSGPSAIYRCRPIQNTAEHPFRAAPRESSPSPSAEVLVIETTLRPAQLRRRAVLPALRSGAGIGGLYSSTFSKTYRAGCGCRLGGGYACGTRG